MMLYYVGGTVPIVAVSYMLVERYIINLGLVNNKFIASFIAILIPMSIVYILFKVIKNISKPKLIANLRFKDNKDLTIILKKKNQLDN